MPQAARSPAPRPLQQRRPTLRSLFGQGDGSINETVRISWAQNDVFVAALAKFVLLLQKEVKERGARQDPWNEADMQGGKQRVMILVHIILNRFLVLILFLTESRAYHQSA
jgi:hypothetical protein